MNIEDTIGKYKDTISEILALPYDQINTSRIESFITENKDVPRAPTMKMIYYVHRGTKSKDFLGYSVTDANDRITNLLLTKSIEIISPQYIDKVNGFFHQKPAQIPEPPLIHRIKPGKYVHENSDDNTIIINYIDIGNGISAAHGKGICITEDMEKMFILEYSYGILQLCYNDDNLSIYDEYGYLSKYLDISNDSSDSEHPRVEFNRRGPYALGYQSDGGSTALVDVEGFVIRYSLDVFISKKVKYISMNWLEEFDVQDLMRVSTGAFLLSREPLRVVYLSFGLADGIAFEKTDNSVDLKFSISGVRVPEEIWYNERRGTVELIKELIGIKELDYIILEYFGIFEELSIINGEIPRHRNEWLMVKLYIEYLKDSDMY